MYFIKKIVKPHDLKIPAFLLWMHLTMVKTDIPKSKQLAKNGPVLMLLKQKGRKIEKEWRDAPFYWPVLMMPANMPNYVYCEE